MRSLADIRKLLPRQESVYAQDAETNVDHFVTHWCVKPQHFSDYNTMSRFLYSNAVSVDRLQAACTIHSMFFFIDDLFFDTDHFDARDFFIEGVGHDLKSIRSFLFSLMHIFKTHTLPEELSAIQMAFYEMGLFVCEQAPDEWFEAFANGIEDYLKAVIQREIDLHRGKTVLTDLDSFLDIRLRDTGGLHTCQLIEFTKGAFLPTEVRNHEQLKHLTWLAIAMASLVNDVFSYHKDVIVEGSDFNLVKILMDLHGMSFEEAVDYSVGLINSYADQFVEDRKYVPFWGIEALDGAVEQYVDGLAEMMAGNLYWHGTTNRYRSPYSPFPELMTFSDEMAAW
jgi:hypothetical protein